MWFKRWRERRRGPVTAQPVEASMLKIPIELADGSTATQLTSVRHWQELVRQSPSSQGDQPILVEDLVAEEHHRWYGKAWLQGRLRFDFLVANGLTPRDRLLDLGCGAGRLGIWLIPYLEPDHYFGVDSHLRSLVAFSAYEILLHGLAARRPRLLLDADFHVDHFGERFDVVIDVSVTRYLSSEAFRRAYAQLRSVLAPAGRIFAAGLTPDRLEHLRREGFEILLEGSPERPLHFVRRQGSSRNAWHVLRLAQTGTSTV
jgi:SAM-dependent methyltransferase